MSEELTMDHSARRWILHTVMEAFSDRYIVNADVYTRVDAKWVRATEVQISLVKKNLVRGGKSCPPITYKVTFEDWKDPSQVAAKVKTALLLMEEGGDQ